MDRLFQFADGNLCGVLCRKVHRDGGSGGVLDGDGDHVEGYVWQARRPTCRGNQDLVSRKVFDKLPGTVTGWPRRELMAGSRCFCRLRIFCVFITKGIAYFTLLHKEQLWRPAAQCPRPLLPSSPVRARQSWISFPFADE